MIHQPFFIPAVLFALISLPLMFSMVPRNRFYGFRTPRTVSDDKIWYPVNRFSGWSMFIASAIYLSLASIHPASGLHDPRVSMIMEHLAFWAMPLVISVVLTLLYLRKLR